MRQHAEALAPFTHGAEVEQVEAYLIGAVGPRGCAGLQALVEADAAAGQVFGAWDAPAGGEESGARQHRTTGREGRGSSAPTL
jgi:hypothetical protein